jgi:hypothetical protein
MFSGFAGKRGGRRGPADEDQRRLLAKQEKEQQLIKEKRENEMRESTISAFTGGTRKNIAARKNMVDAASKNHAGE